MTLEEYCNLIEMLLKFIIGIMQEMIMEINHFLLLIF